MLGSGYIHYPRSAVRRKYVDIGESAMRGALIDDAVSAMFWTMLFHRILIVLIYVEFERFRQKFFGPRI